MTTTCADCGCTGIEIERPGELPKGHEGEEGLCASKEIRDAAHAVKHARDLDHLLAAIQHHESIAPAEDDRPASQQIDMTSLPTFGGEEPASAHGVWSWDATRLLVGPRESELEIVSREEWAERKGTRAASAGLNDGAEAARDAHAEGRDARELLGRGEPDEGLINGLGRREVYEALGLSWAEGEERGAAFHTACADYNRGYREGVQSQLEPLIKKVGWIGHDHAQGERCPDGGARCTGESWGGEPGTLEEIREQAAEEIGTRAEDGTVCESVEVVDDGDGHATVHAYYVPRAEQ